MKKIFILLAFALLVTTSCKEKNSEIADTVIYGTIYTAEQDAPTAEAIAVKDGKFVYVGNKDGVKSFIKKDVTEIIDHTGKGMIMPGCTDAHAHYFSVFALANKKDGLSLSPEDDKAKLIEKLEAASLKAIENKKQSMYSMGWNFHIIMPERPTLAEMDAATHGVSTAILDITGHHILCNSECLRRCGIIDDNGEVLIKEIEGGLLELDEKGYPTGYINERATGFLIRMGGIVSEEIVDDELAESAVISSQELMLSTGYVSLLEAWSNNYNSEKFYEAASRLDNAGKIKTLLSLTYEVEPWQKDMSEQIDHLAYLNEKYRTRHVRPEYLKLFMDGCVEDKTGAMSTPYKDGSVCKSYWSVDRLAEITRECNAKGLTVHTHVMGDNAIKETTDAYIKGGDGLHRNCLAHLRHPRKEDFKRFADNNIACTAGITWHVGDETGDSIMSTFLDKEYILHAYPIKSFFDAGVKVTSHTDYPANEASPQDPFGIMEIAVRGQMVNPVTGQLSPTLDTAELVTLEQAFQALTINGAWQLGLENERGSIKVGKWADFVLTDKNVFDCPITDIHETKVVSTWFEGEKVYEQDPTTICEN